jgi:mannan endo-1,4-beta-mannosidase
MWRPPGSHGPGPRRGPARRGQAGVPRIAAIAVATVIVVAAGVAVALHSGSPGGGSARPGGALRVTDPRTHGTYLGVYAPPAPVSYAGVTAFAAATGVRPGLALYYSGWGEPFQSRFAATAASHHAVTLVQLDPTGISLAAIASGRYDAYLRGYASAVKTFGRPVVIGFGHEVNGNWYSWAHQHTSPAVFVEAWRHIVTVFRTAGASNVTWLWTVNVIDRHVGIPSPAPWWPGSSYVTWVGIDGYYSAPSWTFASLFGPTIKAVRALTLDPILVSETGATQAAGQSAKIGDLFAGVRAYGLLGFVWFDAAAKQDWRIQTPAAMAAFHRGAAALKRP